MRVSSRTPEGDWFTCRVCGSVDRVEPSPVTGDAVCPRCGGYLTRLVARFDDLPRVPLLDADSLLAELSGGDSLDTLELVMKLEEEFGTAFDADELARCRTVGDLIRYLSRLPGDDAG